MAVSDTIVLPDAAAVFVPLAGDGFAAPFAMYCTEQTLAGASGGGLASLIISLDPRYSSMVQFISWVISQPTPANAEYSVSVSPAPNGSSTRIGHNGTCESVAILGSVGNVSGYWSPPAMVIPAGDGVNPAIGLNFLNVDATTYVMSTQILLWNINVRYKTAYQILVGAQSGPASASQNV